MNLRMILKYLGLLVLAEAVFLLPPAVTGLLYGEAPAVLACLAGSGACLVVGLALFLPNRKQNGSIYAREGFVVAGAGWLLVSLMGALPFFLGGDIPRFSDAFFESVAGFTTTGTFIHSNLDTWSRALLFWRNFSQWLGGIGVLSFILIVVRAKSGSGLSLQLYRAESPGPQVGKFMPKTRDGVRIMYFIYIGLSALNLLFLLLGGMPLFDALCTMFGTAGTGGFGVRNDSMASYSPYLQGVCTVFMLLFGVSFSLYALLLMGGWRTVLKNEELRWYGGIVAVSILAITLSLVASGRGGAGHSMHEASFMVSSVITSTGLSIGEYATWPAFARAILFLLMIIGAMGGSTAGGFKVGRMVILLKSLRAGLYRMIHPRSVTTARMNGHVLEEEVFQRSYLYLFTYCIAILASFLLVSVDGMPLEANLTAVIACFNNIGPGFGLIDSVANFDSYSLFSKLVLAFNMLLGRLEIFPLIMLFSPATWRMKA